MTVSTLFCYGLMANLFRYSRIAIYIIYYTLRNDIQNKYLYTYKNWTINYTFHIACGKRFVMKHIIFSDTIFKHSKIKSQFK